VRVPSPAASAQAPSPQPSPEGRGGRACLPRLGHGGAMLLNAAQSCSIAVWRSSAVRGGPPNVAQCCSTLRHAQHQGGGGAPIRLPHRVTCRGGPAWPPSSRGRHGRGRPGARGPRRPPRRQRAPTQGRPYAPRPKRLRESFSPGAFSHLVKERVRTPFGMFCPEGCAGTTGVLGTAIPTRRRAPWLPASGPLSSTL